MKKKRKKTKTPVAEETNIFRGLMTWMNMINFLVAMSITQYEVKPGITEVEIKGNTIFIHPHLERIISELLKEIKSNEHHS